VRNNGKYREHCAVLAQNMRHGNALLSVIIPLGKGFETMCSYSTCHDMRCPLSGEVSPVFRD
jgi:hypothetical protein